MQGGNADLPGGDLFCNALQSCGLSETGTFRDQIGAAGSHNLTAGIGDVGRAACAEVDIADHVI